MTSGCAGEIQQGIGCLAYLGSDQHLADAQSEDGRRKPGSGSFGGFAVQYDSAKAMMFGHLQGSHNMSFDEATAALKA